MSMRERTNQRDRTYSNWHRPDSTRRFLGLRQATQLSMIDIDDCEACFCSEPLALIETARSSGNGNPKAAPITQALGKRANLPVYSVSYVRPDIEFPPQPIWPDITDFWVRQLWPATTDRPVHWTPQEYAEWLQSLRVEHFVANHHRFGSVNQDAPPISRRA